MTNAPAAVEDPAGDLHSGASLPLLLVLGAAVLVVLAVSGEGLVRLPAELTGAWVRVVRLGGAALALLGLAGLLSERRRLAGVAAGGRDPTVAALRSAAVIMGVVTLVALLNPPVALEVPVEETLRAPPPPREQQQERSGGQGEAPPETPPQGGMGGIGVRAGPAPSTTFGDAEPDSPAQDEGEPLWRLARFLPYLMFLAMVALVYLMSKRERAADEEEEPPPLDVPPVGRGAAEAGIEASLGEVLAARLGHRPGDQITAAYFRLLHALTEAGGPKRAHEAPHEHLNRVLGPLGVSPEPLHSLAELYVIAQFSRRPIRDADRAAAAGCLESALTSLRSRGHVRVEAPA